MEYAYELPEVALDFMNEEHEQVVEIVNNLIIQFAATIPDHLIVTQALQELVHHCRAHFAREEKLMQEYQFPPYGCHYGEHTRLLAELDAELIHWQTEHDLARLDLYIQKTLVPWFMHHVTTMDTVTALFIRQQGG